jgi:2'-deoxynucleoside 5'-phosphate N-hydrolase
MTAYISIGYQQRKNLSKELNAITGVLQQFHIQPLVFVDQYSFTNDEEKQMMQQAMAAIDSCDLLIAETSEKRIGIGVEAGYAKAKGKPVIYCRHRDAEHSTTVSGISDFQVVYTDSEDLYKQFVVVLNKINITFHSINE